MKITWKIRCAVSQYGRQVRPHTFRQQHMSLSVVPGQPRDHLKQVMCLASPGILAR